MGLRPLVVAVLFAIAVVPQATTAPAAGQADALAARLASAEALRARGTADAIRPRVVAAGAP